MITIPNFENYRQGDFIQYMNNVLQVVTAARAATFNIVPQRTALQDSMNALNAAWQPVVGSELTPEISELDQKRDRCFNGLKMTVDNWGINHYDLALRESAYLISDRIAGYGDRISLMRYQQQTATVTAIIQELGDVLAPHVDALALQGWVTELSSLNTLFNEKYVERAQSISGKQSGEVVELMNLAITSFRDMKMLFESRFAVAVADGNASADFQQTENEWSTLSQQYNDAVNRSAQNEATEENDSEEQANPPSGPTDLS